MTDANSSGVSHITLVGSNQNNSPIWTEDTGKAGRTHAWPPYGHGSTDHLSLGFNGERIDPVSRTYHLGNGYRTYNPALMRFNCPDSLSPFGPGGINPYAYCAGDPINHTDPSGHISVGAGIGIGLGVVGILGGAFALFTGGASIGVAGAIAAAVGLAADGTGIASAATEESDPQTSATLGWVSLGMGIVSGMAGAAPAVAKGLNNATVGLRSRLGNIRRIGLSGDAPAAGRNLRLRTGLNLHLQPIYETDQFKDMLLHNVHYVHGTTSASFEGVSRFRALLSMEEIDGTAWFHKNQLASGERGYTIVSLYSDQPISKGVSLNSINKYTDSLKYAAKGDGYPVLYGFGSDISINRDFMEHTLSLGGISIDKLKAVYVPKDMVEDARNRLAKLPRIAVMVRPLL